MTENKIDILKYRSLLAAIATSRNKKMFELEARLRGFNLKDIINLKSEYLEGEAKDVSERIIKHVIASDVSNNIKDYVYEEEKKEINLRYLRERDSFNRKFGYARPVTKVVTVYIPKKKSAFSKFVEKVSSFSRSLFGYRLRYT